MRPWVYWPVRPVVFRNRDAASLHCVFGTMAAVISSEVVVCRFALLHFSLEAIIVRVALSRLTSFWPPVRRWVRMRSLVVEARCIATAPIEAEEAMPSVRDGNRIERPRTHLRIKTQGVDILQRVSRHISVRAKTPVRHSNRIALDIAACAWLIVPEVVVMGAEFRIKVLAGEP